MKHVFVETNFLIEVARPNPGRDAQQLLARATSSAPDVRLYLPWVSAAEARRTMERIVREDLGFDEPMMKFGVRAFQQGSITAAEKQVLDRVAVQARRARSSALTSLSQSLDAVVRVTEVIEPSRAVVQRTLGLYPVKALPPFDEMVLGAVLTRAAELHHAGASPLFFCNLNKKDFDSQNRPELAAEYSACGLTFLASFVIP